MSVLAWHDPVPRDGWVQMAIDRAMVDLARATGATLFRLYQWRVDTVSFGANEAATRSWDRDALARDGVPCVRRPTGGRAVWHGRDDLTYAWAGPSGGPTGTRQRYRDLHRQLARAIDRGAAPVALAGRPSRPADLSPGACFDLAVGGEILVGERKVVGSAQKVMGSILLQHGAIAISAVTELDRYRLGSSPAARTSQDSRLPEAPQLAERILATWREDGSTPAPAELTERLLTASVEYGSQFRDPAWTWRR